MLVLLLLVGMIVFLTWRNWNRTSDEDSGALIFKLIITAAVVGFFIYDLVPRFKEGGRVAAFALPVAALSAAVLAATWARGLIGWAVSPFTGQFDGGDIEVEARPQLSAVHAKRMQGRYDDAEADLRGQLEQFPEDFEAQMVLAELLVEYQKDFEAGKAVIENILTQEHPPTQIAATLNALADWQLKHRSDPDAARAALQRIIALFPETEIAAKANQRLAHVPTSEELAARREPKKHTVVEVEDYIKPGGRRGNVGVAAEKSAEQQVDELCERLRRHPQDTEAREQLALLYADELGQLEWALDQLNQLIRQPNQSDRNVIHWHELAADICRRHGDIAGTCRSYQRIIEEFPKTAAAQRATNQLRMMGMHPDQPKQAKPG
jgi:tetratricopeptide (TPR) repeat protein